MYKESQFTDLALRISSANALRMLVI